MPSRSSQRKRLVVDRPKQLRTLTSPVRLEMLELFGIFGPCSVAEVARRMDRPADALYYHLRKLLEVGLVERAGEQVSTRRPEAVYRLAAEEIEVPRKASSPAARELTHKAVDSVLRLAGRELKSALDGDAGVDEGSARDLYGRRLRARLSLRALRELNKHIEAIEQLFYEANRRGAHSSRPVAVTLVLTPVPTRGED